MKYLFAYFRSIPLSRHLRLANFVAPFLRKIDLNGKRFDDRQLEDFLRCCPNTKELKVAKYYDDATHAINGVIDQLPPGLELLDLSYHSNLNDAEIDKLPHGLKSLKLNNCDQLTDAAIVYYCFR
jgi:hypothetical protein